MREVWSLGHVAAMWMMVLLWATLTEVIRRVTAFIHGLWLSGGRAFLRNRWLALAR